MSEYKPIEVFIYPALLAPGETVRDGSSGEPRRITEPTVLVWIDMLPGYRYAHPTWTVLIGASEVRVHKGDWWAVIDDQLRFPMTSDIMPSVVFPINLGEARLHVLSGVFHSENELTDGTSGRPLPIESESLVFWLDLHPGAKFHHATRYIILNAHGATVVDGSERPTLAGQHHPIGLPIAVSTRQALQVPQLGDIDRADAMRVSEVVLADIAQVKAHRERLTLTAVATVPTLGWSNARLAPHVYIAPPADGIWAYDFVAKPPTGPAASAVGTVSATVTLLRHEELKGVRIHTAQNEYVLRMPEVIDGELPDGDAFQVESCAIESDQLVMKVSYSGGCRTHGFRLIWNGKLMKSNPPQAAFRLLHDANNDPCRAHISETLRFDLLDLPPAQLRVSMPSGDEYTLHYRQSP